MGRTGQVGDQGVDMGQDWGDIAQLASENLALSPQNPCNNRWLAQASVIPVLL